MKLDFEVNEMAARLREIRLKSELTQDLFAKSLNISQSAFSAYEHGKREVPIKVVCALAANFDVNPIWFIFGTGDQKLKL